VIFVGRCSACWNYRLRNDLDETPFDHVGGVMQRQFFDVIASASEAIQLLEREAGLLRRFTPRNDGEISIADGISDGSP
jgi:hypothetical protein